MVMTQIIQSARCGGLVLDPYDGGRRSCRLRVSGKLQAGDDWQLPWDGRIRRGAAIRIDGIGNDLNRVVSLSELQIEKGTKKKDASLHEPLGSGEGP